MSDAIARLLRLAAKDPAGTDTHVAIYRDLCTEAAAEIERLQIALREASRIVNDMWGWHSIRDRADAEAINTLRGILDAAFSGKEET